MVMFVIPIIINYKSDRKFVQYLSMSLSASFLLSFIMKITISSASLLKLHILC